MILPKIEDGVHRGMLYRLLKEMLDDKFIAQNVYFKGGTCAAMLGWLDRFSVDLDFDLKTYDAKIKNELRKRLKIIFEKVELNLYREDKKQLFFVFKYKAPIGFRSSLKLSVVDFLFKEARYEAYFLPGIDRMAFCQTKETMFASKLLALTSRHEKYKEIAGRDLYDIWYFFWQGAKYNYKLIKEEKHMENQEFFKKLADFVEKNVSQRLIDEDLNQLLPQERFQKVRKFLKQELLMFLRNEAARLKKEAKNKL